MPVFDRDFVQQTEARYPDALSWEGSDLAAVTLSPERTLFREWIEHEVTNLPEPGRNKLIARLRSGRHFVTGVNELAAAAVLRDAGLPVEYETDLNGCTPDLFVPPDGDRRPIIVEVWTREPPREATGQLRAWQDLQRRIAKIPVPVGLGVESPSGDAYRAPTSVESKKLAVAARKWLLGTVPMPGDCLNVDGYRFQVWGTVPRLNAVLAIPGRTSRLDSEFVIDAINNKVRKYVAVTNDLGAQLVVVLAAHPLAPLEIGLIRSALEGRLSLTVRFPPDARGTIADWKVRMRSDDAAACFDPVLSAVGWIKANLGDPDLTLLPVESGCIATSGTHVTSSRPAVALRAPRRPKTGCCVPRYLTDEGGRPCAMRLPTRAVPPRL